jgi:preprotein translocase subunit SecE
MTREMKTKRVLFYLTVIMFVMFAFVLDGIIDNGLTQGAIWYIATYLTVALSTVISFWGCTKEEFEKITGIDFFSEN